MTELETARLHVLLARDVPLGVVIRRGPSKKVATLLWDRTNDAFTLGQWLKGRIYERKCDLSPDGKFLIYFALNGKWQSESEGSWTAISRAPYLKAIEFFPEGETYQGGGLWTGPSSYWLNTMHPHNQHPIHRTTSGIVKPAVGFKPENEFGYSTIYYSRLLSSGWGYVKQNRLAKHQHESVFEKELPSGWKLRKRDMVGIVHPTRKVSEWEVHELVAPSGEDVVTQPDWEWADWDGKRLMWASQGRLFAAKIRSAGIFEPKELYDFNAMKFEAIEAPY